MCEKSWERGYFFSTFLPFPLPFHDAETRGSIYSLIPRPVTLSVTRGKVTCRIWYLKSRDQHTSSSTSKDGCISLHFTEGILSLVSLWHKWAIKKSYKKCRFATFICCLRITSVLATLIITSRLLCYFLSAHVTSDPRPCDNFCVTKTIAGHELKLLHNMYKMRCSGQWSHLTLYTKCEEAFL